MKMMVKFIEYDHIDFQMGDEGGCRVGFTRVEYYRQHVKTIIAIINTITYSADIIMPKIQKAEDMADVSVEIFQVGANFCAM